MRTVIRPVVLIIYIILKVIFVIHWIIIRIIKYIREEFVDPLLIDRLNIQRSVS